MNALEARVRAYNAANTIANEYSPKLAEALQPFVGEKVILATGKLTSKVNEKLKPLLEEIRAKGGQIWRRDTSYSINYGLLCSEANGHHTCTSAEVWLNIGEISGDQLVKLYPIETRRTDWTAAEVIEARKKAQLLHDQLSEAESAFRAFGYNDNTNVQG